MLDEARHFWGMKKVKQILDWMAFYKLNRFHWHLTDSQGWRIEIKKYPKLALIGGIGNYGEEYTSAQFYTQEEIKEIVSYAREETYISYLKSICRDMRLLPPKHIQSLVVAVLLNIPDTPSILGKILYTLI